MSIESKNPFYQEILDEYEIRTYEELECKKHLHPMLLEIFLAASELLLRRKNIY